MENSVPHSAHTTSIAQDVRERLATLGFQLPSPPAPVGAYRGVVARKGIAAISGQFPLVDGVVRYPGIVGKGLTAHEAQAAAALAALNVIAQIAAATRDFADFGGLLRVDGYVASSSDFFGQPTILDGASTLLVNALGDELGAHSRAAFAVTHLPLNAAVELAVTFAVHSRS